MSEPHPETAAPHPDHVAETEVLLEAIAAMEISADQLTEKLAPFDKPGTQLPGKDLSQMREGLKRIAARVGVCVALSDRVTAEPEKVLEPVADADPSAITVTAEDEMFPIEGFSDSLTALPTRAIAEKAVESALDVGRPRYAAVCVLDRICHMSSRYGAEFGTQAIRHCVQFLTQKLPSDSLLFRWRGAAFVALFDNSGTLSEAKLVIEQIAIQKQKFNFMSNHRSAMVNLTVSFLTIPLADHITPESVFKLVDQFVESHSSRQPH